MGFLINCSIVKEICFDDNSFNMSACFDVSGKPPLLLIIIADPLLAASKLVLPNGSSHREQITEILILLSKLRTVLWSV